MKHIIVGGDGFLGRHLAQALLERGEQVVVASLEQSDLDIYRRVPFQRVDVTRPAEVAELPIEPDDVVHHLAARLLMPIVRRSQREDHFWSVNHQGTANLLAHVERCGGRKLVYFTTDMVYGHTESIPKTEDHPRVPLGPYGASKFASEKLCESYRDRGLQITIFRPRLIIGPGRLGILVKLFRLIERNLPVPVIGDGSNPYQFVSVFDCVSAILAAVDRDFPNAAYNLGSLDPPTVRALLDRLIEAAGSRSFLVPTPAGLVKRVLAALDALGLPLMDPEQYLIADERCVLDVSKAARELGWRPRYRDEDMLLAAFQEYKRSSTRRSPAAQVAEKPGGDG